jgi:hypothetical protein
MAGITLLEAAVAPTMPHSAQFEPTAEVPPSAPALLPEHDASCVHRPIFGIVRGQVTDPIILAAIVDRARAGQTPPPLISRTPYMPFLGCGCHLQPRAKHAQEGKI